MDSNVCLACFYGGFIVRLNQRNLCTQKSMPSGFHESCILVHKVYTSKDSIKAYIEEKIYPIYIQCTHTCKDRTPLFFNGRGQAHRVGLQDCMSKPSSRRRQSQPLSNIPPQAEAPGRYVRVRSLHAQVCFSTHCLSDCGSKCRSIHTRCQKLLHFGRDGHHPCPHRRSAGKPQEIRWICGAGNPFIPNGGLICSLQNRNKTLSSIAPPRPP